MMLAVLGCMRREAELHCVKPFWRYSMNRLALGVIAGALGTLFAMPSAMAQSWQDMQHDQYGIEHKEAQIHHDQNELNEDVSNGDYGAARHEQREMNRREARLQDQEQDPTRIRLVMHGTITTVIMMTTEL
jgi:hypothetical protein